MKTKARRYTREGLYEQVVEAPSGEPSSAPSSSKPAHLDYYDVDIATDPDPDTNRFLCPGWLTCFLTVINPFTLVGAPRVNRQSEATLTLNWGKYSGLQNQPGCFCLNPIGTTVRVVSLKERTTELRDEKLIDLKGNPVVCSGVVFWKIKGVKAAMLNVENVSEYVKTCALASLKQVVSKYPYESDEKTGGPSLKTEGEALGREMSLNLQQRLAHAGVKVIAFNMTDLSYAPEIAQAMLVRQQAEAMVKARKLIVKGAVDISEGAIQQLQDKGIHLSAQDQSLLLSQLLSVICAEKKQAHPKMVSTSQNGATAGHLKHHWG